MSLLHARSLSVRFGARTVLDGVDAAIGAGEWVGLVGPNGSGKTTLLRALAGLLPHDGEVTLDGRPVRSWTARERARRLAVVRQSQPMAFDFTVEEFVLMGRAPHRGWLEPFTAADRQRAAEALVEVEMSGFEGRMLSELSGGEQQRVRLAQALAQDAPILLLDEPTAHLDVHHQYDLMAQAASLVAAGRTVVAAVHDLPLAARFVRRLLVLHDGRLAADGPPADVLTPELLRRVFRMDAEVEAGAPLSIRYLSPA
jgi:iron complex transport system ATP-binding protein